MAHPRDLHLLIKANFAPARGAQRLSRATRILGVVMGLCLFLALLLYGVTVHVGYQLNQASKQALALNEQNKELQVSLNRIKSFKNVEATAARAPHLVIPQEVIDITAVNTDALPNPPERTPDPPRIYGY